MSDRYKGAILSPTAPTVTPQSAGGIYTSSQQLQYQGQGVWPTAFNNPINNSLRFRSSATGYLNRTPASAGNRKTWTWSGWVKRGTLGTNQSLFTCYFANNDTSYLTISFTSDNLNIGLWNTSILYTSAVYRDPSAWYHIVLAIDTTQATASNRAKLYVNGVQVTAFGSTGYPTQNTDLAVNSAAAHYISTYDGTNYKFDGYLAEINFIDGTALTPSSFGTTDAYGIWQPIPYTGAYGTNGFYLPFTDNSALTTSSNVGLGKDFSGNGNYWVTNNISITAGSTYDSMKDVPTNTNSNTANFATFNPLMNFSGAFSANPTFSQANLLASGVADTKQYYADSTIQVSSGKWYAEFTPSAVTLNASYVGIATDSYLALYAPTAEYYNNSSWSAYGATYTTNDVIGVAYDADAQTITFYKNGTSQGQKTGITGGNARFRTSSYNTGASHSWTANFGQRPFSYTPPSGFYPLNTYNLPTPTILDGDQYFNATIYTGTGSAQSITNSGSMQPDFIWFKSRGPSTNLSNALTDTVRGINLVLNSNNTAAEATDGVLTSFNTNGFTTGASANSNKSGDNFVAWQWRANAGTNVSNTQGTITSTVSANTTAGFSIVTYTGTGANATVGHGLGVAPKWVIVKGRNVGSTNWFIYTETQGATKYLDFSTGTGGTDTSAWNSSTPTSTVFSVGTSYYTNYSATTYVAYCFAQVAGYSAFGSYTGNGSADGPFVFLGFRPRYVLFKRTDTSGFDWFILDTSRNTYNVMTQELYPNLSLNELTANDECDFLSNGFKIRRNNTPVNASGGTYIYMAFAENPFKIARAR